MRRNRRIQAIPILQALDDQAKKLGELEDKLKSDVVEAGRSWEYAKVDLMNFVSTYRANPQDLEWFIPIADEYQEKLREACLASKGNMMSNPQLFVVLDSEKGLYQNELDKREYCLVMEEIKITRKHIDALKARIIQEYEL